MPYDVFKAVKGEFFACSSTNLNFCVLRSGRISGSMVTDVGCLIARLYLCTGWPDATSWVSDF